MSRRTGVLCRVRKRIKGGHGGKGTLKYLNTILLDPCVYCGKFGCDSIDHITPIAKREQLSTGRGINHWSNFAPCHKRCNEDKQHKGILHVLLKKAV